MKNWLKIFFISLIFMCIHYIPSYAAKIISGNPNTPILLDNMTPIKWDNLNEIETTSNDLDWYNYEDKKLANAKDSDGNYWVWIPRFTYRIYGDRVQIRWSSGTTDYTEEEYKTHPAFVSESYIGGDPNEYGSYSNRILRNELTGFWVAKYLASSDGTDISIANNKQADISKNIGEAFDKCLEMKNTYGVSTHLLKASEWGAVAYLTSAFGVSPTANGTGLTGGNPSNSTTNNYYGVYDMNGPVGEYLSAYVVKNVLNPAALGYAGKMIDSEYENFIDIVNLVGDDNSANNEARLHDFYGFAMSETSDFVLNDIESVPTGSEPFFSKGEIGVGIYGYNKTSGTGLSFRPSIAIYTEYLSEDITFFDTEASVVAGDYLVLSVNFSVSEDWKFDLDEDEVIIDNGKVVNGKEKRIFDFIDLRYVQNNKVMTLTNANLNEHLIGFIEDDTTLMRLDSDTVFRKDKQYTVRVRVGGYNSDDQPVFLAIPGMTSKIIVNSISVISADAGNALKVTSIPNNKVRLSIYDSQGRIPILTGVRLVAMPEKTDYYVGERLSLAGGKVEVSYGDNKAIVDLVRDNVPDYETATNTPGDNQFVELVYNNMEVVQDDVQFIINVNGNEKFNVRGSVKPVNTAVIVSGIGQYEAGDTVELKASLYPGYRFVGWSSTDVSISGATSVNGASFTMPSKNVTVIAETMGVSRLEVIDAKTEFERGEGFGLGDGKIIAHYSNGTSEVLTLSSNGVTSTPSQNQILDELGEQTVTIKYGGQTLEYTINIVKEKYNLTLYIDSLNSGSIKMGDNSILPDGDKLTYTMRISYDDAISFDAIPLESYSFYGWYISESDIVPSDKLKETNISFTMPKKNVILKASFVKTYLIKYIANDENYGYISGEVEQIVNHGGSTKEVTAVANDGYKFKNWSDARTIKSRAEQYVVDDAEYIANFVKTWTVQYLVDGSTFAVRTIENGENGYISEMPEKYGYIFSNWDKDLEYVTSDIVTNAVFTPWISFDPNGSIVPNDFVETHIKGVGVKEDTLEYIISESDTDTGENVSDYISNDLFKFEGSWEKSEELYRSYVKLASKEDSSTTITIFSDNDKEIVRFDYMFAVTSGQLLGITINGVRVTEYDEEINVWHNFNREVNTVDGKIVIGISYSQDSEYADTDYAAIRNLKTGRHWIKISSEHDLKDSAIWSDNYVHVRGSFPYYGEYVSYQVVSKAFKGNNTNFGDTFDIKYELNGGNDPGNPTTYTADSDDITLINPTKSGTEFVGWTGSNGAAPMMTVTIPKGSTGNKTYKANWKSEIYTITYNLNGGSVFENPSSYTIDSDDIVLINPTKDGAEFIGWIGTDIDTATKMVTIPKGSIGNRQYKAIWQDKTYNVDVEATTGGTVDGAGIYAARTTVTLNAVPNDKYTFKYWTVRDGEVSLYDPSSATVSFSMPYNDLVLKAEFTRNPQALLTVKMLDSITENYEDVGTVISRSAMDKEGYTFKRWNVTGISLSDEQCANKAISFIMPVNAVRLEAVYDNDIQEAKQYTVTYNANGGSGAPSSQTKIQDVDLVLSETKPTRSGYTFSGWNTKQDGYGDNYSSGATYTANVSVTLYAKWVAGSGTGYTVYHYFENVDDTNYTLNKTENKTGTTGATITLADEKMAITGGTYKQGALTENGTATTSTVIAADGSTKIYLYYSRNTYTLTLNKGTYISSVSGAGTYKYGKSVSIGATLDSATGYTYSFTNWTSNNTSLLANQTSMNTKITMPAGDVTLTANGSRTTKPTYTVTYNANGGSGAPSSQTKIQDVDLVLSETKPTRSGYTFSGWNTKQDGSGDNYSSGATYIANVSVTLYAKWVAGSGTGYTVYHYFENVDDTNYTLNKTENKTGTTGATITLADEKMAITGGTYKQGALTENGTATTSTVIAADGSTKIYLYYSRNTYTLTLNKGTYISSVSGAGTYKYGKSVSISATLNSATGYTYSFTNWTSNNTSLLANQTSRSTKITMPAGNVTLTANGTRSANSYTITYSVNGGSGSAPSSQTKVYGQSLTLRTYSGSKSGYDFNGWSTSSSATSATWSSGGTMGGTDISSNVTLYAVWSERYSYCSCCGGNYYTCPCTSSICSTCGECTYHCSGHSYECYDAYLCSVSSTCDSCGHSHSGRCTQTVTTVYNCSTCGGSGKVVDTCSTCGGSGTVNTCSRCNDTGLYSCSTCGGSGTLSCSTTVSCSSCSGSGKVTCSSCGGSGQEFVRYAKHWCNRCGGNQMWCYDCGKSYGPQYSDYATCQNSGHNIGSCPGDTIYGSCQGYWEVPVYQNCSDCEGTGKDNCSNCRGTGRVTCSTCSGSGSKDCPNCSDGYVMCISHSYVSKTCPTCNGKTQYKTCRSCNGSGTKSSSSSCGCTSSNTCSHGNSSSHYYCSTHNVDCGSSSSHTVYD